jgi:hypothetical protein
MRIWSKLIALILVLVLASGLVQTWLLLGPDAPWTAWALLAVACVLPALGLLVWLRATSVGAHVFLVVAALAGGATSAFVWLTILFLQDY